MSDASASIAAALADLYERADATPPDPEHCVAPLAELVGAYNLTCTERRGLSSRAAGESLLARGALLDPPAAADDDPLAGFLYADQRYGAIFVERADRLTRRRFSIAHELGHYVLHFRPALQHVAADGDVLPVATDAFPRQESEETTPDRLPTGRMGVGDGIGALPPFEVMERQANQLAVELLMPFPVLLGLVDRYGQTFRDDDLVWRLATDMLVSRATMQWRLTNLGLLHTRRAES